MQNERASKKQQELLQFVDGFIKGNGYGPSYREIMRALGYKSVSTVAVHIDGLIAKGYLHRRNNSARSLEVVTLREPTSQPTTEPKLETQLIDYIRTKTLSDSDHEVVLKAVEILELAEVAKAVQTTDA